MTNLSNYIRNNLNLFNTDEPPNGHFDRFERKLDRIGKKSRNHRSLFLFVKIAAILVLAIVISYIVFRQSGYYKYKTGKIIAYTNYPELKEAEQYYNNQLKLYYVKLNDLQFENDKSQKKQILNELTEMDRQVKTMKRDLFQNPEDERVVNAIINYYQIKIELMDLIITKTQKSMNTIF